MIVRSVVDGRVSLLDDRDMISVGVAPDPERQLNCEAEFTKKLNDERLTPMPITLFERSLYRMSFAFSGLRSEAYELPKPIDTGVAVDVPPPSAPPRVRLPSVPPNTLVFSVHALVAVL